MVSRQWALVVLLLFWAASARADDAEYLNGAAPTLPNSPHADEGKPKNPDRPKPCDPALDPVELDSGAFYLRPEDLTTPDLVIPVRGHTIDLRRSYRYHYAYNGALGVGWDFAMNSRLRQLDTGDVLITSGTCRTDRFTYTPTGFTSPPGVIETLVLNADGTYSQTFRSGLEHRFDANGSLVLVRDRFGNAITLSYSAQKMPIQGINEFFVDTTVRVVALEYRLNTITDPTGRQIQFAYNPNGRIQTVTDWTGRVWSYAHDVRGNLTQVTSPGTSDFPTGTSTTYVYDDSRFPNAITKILAPNQQGTQSYRVVNTYDAQGRVTRQDHGDGAFLTIAYDPPNNRTTVTDANGTQKIYTLASGQLVSETVVTHGVRGGEPAGTQFTTSYVYTAEQRSRTVLPEGNAIERSYDPNNPNPLARGNLLQIRRLPKPGSSAPALVTSFTYKTPYQQIGTITDPAGHVTEFFYDAASNLQSIQFPSVPEGSPQQNFTVNVFGQVATMTDENGNTTLFVYDGNGYLDQVTRAYGTTSAATTELDPDSLGRPTVVRDPNGHATSLVYGAWDKLEMSFAPAPFGYQTQFHYDADGNLSQVDRQSEIAGNPQTTVMTYGMFDQLTSITDELGETTAFGYDGNRNRTVVLDPEQNSTITIFDERDLPYQTTDAEARVTRLNYQPNGTLAQVIDGNGHATAYAPDDFDRLQTITHADSTTEQFLYDPTGNLTRKTTRASQPINFNYDARNRLRSRASPTETATFLYDLGGRMTHAQNSAATEDFAYDPRDELLTETTNIPGLATQIVQHQYDLAGKRTRLTYPDGAYVSYVYDELNRLHILRDDQGVDQVTYSYDELSRITHMLRASGVTSDYTYDRASRVKTIVHNSPSAGVLESLAYDYNPSGAIQHMTDHNGLHVFGYDKTYQLTSVDYPDASPFPDITYNYDAAGNRTSTVTAAGTVAYAANALNEYTSVGGVSQSYDLNGNLTSDGTNTYTFDAENRLVSANTPSGTASYSYDPFMRRTCSSKAGQCAFSVWTDNRVLLGSDPSGTQRMVFGGGRSPVPVQIKLGPGATVDIHTDRLLSPRVATAVDASSSWNTDYEAFGSFRVTPATGVWSALRFPGQYQDAETKLLYNRFRSFDPSAGRYTSADPLGQRAGANLYAYVRNDPTEYADPAGLAIGDLPPAPPGYDPGTWDHGTHPNNGKDWVRDPDGNTYTSHPEDNDHWRHWDIQDPEGNDSGSYPEKPDKPWPNQKKKPYGDQSPEDPSGDAPSWKPPAGDSNEMCPYEPPPQPKPAPPPELSPPPWFIPVIPFIPDLEWIPVLIPLLG